MGRPAIGRRLLVALLLAAPAIFVALAARFYLTSTRLFFEGAELRTIDARFQFRGARTTTELKTVAREVAIVAIDDDATRRFGRILPRAVHGRLVRRLKQAGVRAIIFDVLFPDSFRGLADDAQFAAACRDAGNVFLPFDDHSTRVTPAPLLEQIRNKLSYRVESDIKPKDDVTVQIQPPLPVFFNAMKGGGHVTTIADIDGKFRASILLMEAKGWYPHVALDAVARTVWKTDPTHQPVQLRDNFLTIGDIRLGPLERRPLLRSNEQGEVVDAGAGWMLPLDFLGEHRDMARLTVPYVDALEGRADERLKGRVVIIGETATGTTDLRPGPFDRREITLGVETNATLIANLIENRFARDCPQAWALAATVLLGLVTAVAFGMLRPWLAFLVTAGALAVYGFFAMAAFFDHGQLLELTGPLLSSGFCFATLIAYRLGFVERERREYEFALRESQALLGQSVGSGIAEQLSNDPEARTAMRIGTRRDATILFSDIRGFTAWSEKQTPEDVKARLDEYFPVMCEIAEDDYGGFIDKFIGDELMVVWNVPYDQDDHAERAVRAALSMQRALDMLNAGWTRQKQEGFRVGIGIATGRVVFGTFGSLNHKLQPTVLGDTVNLASRLQTATKDTGAKIIIDETTYQRVRDKFEVRSLGVVPIRGKSDIQAIYEVVGVKQSTEDNQTTGNIGAARGLPALNSTLGTNGEADEGP